MFEAAYNIAKGLAFGELGDLVEGFAALADSGLAILTAALAIMLIAYYFYTLINERKKESKLARQEREAALKQQEREAEREAQRTEIAKTDLTEHEFFWKTDAWLEQSLPALRFGSPKKTYVFRKLLTITMRHFQTNLRAFCQRDLVGSSFSKTDLRLTVEFWVIAEVLLFTSCFVEYLYPQDAQSDHSPRLPFFEVL